MHKSVNVRTYANSSRIAISTIQTVAVDHIVSGNRVYAQKALAELKSAIEYEYQQKNDTYNKLLQIYQNQALTPDQIKLQLIKNKIKFRG